MSIVHKDKVMDLPQDGGAEYNPLMNLIGRTIFIVLFTLAVGCGGGEDETTTDDGTTDISPDVSEDATTGDEGLEDGTGSEVEISETDTEEDTDTSATDAEPDVPAGSTALKVKIDDKYLSADYYELPSVVPGVLAEARVKVQIINEGSEALEINGASLQPYNDDGSPKSVWVSLDYLGFNPKQSFPITLAPQSQDASSVFTLEVVYAPKAFDINMSTLKVLSNDSQNPEFKVRFLTPPVAPEVRVEPADNLFEKATLSNYEERIFRIFNDGVLPLKFVKLVFAEPTDVFTIVSQPGLGGQVPPPGTPDYKPLFFTIRYQPTYGSVKDKNVVLLYTNDPNNNPVSIPLEGTFETDQDTSPCILIPPSQNLNFVDFSEVESGSETKTVTMKNVGKKVCTLNKVELPNDLNGIWYNYSLMLPSNIPGGAMEPVQELPISFGAGKSVLIQLTYTAQNTGLDSELTVEFEDPNPATSILNVVGGGAKAIFDYAPGLPEEPAALQFAGATQSSVERTFVVYNKGDANLLIDSFTFSENETPEFPSNYWQLKGFFAFPIKVKPNRVKAFTVEMATGFEPANPEGTMTIDYLGNKGEASISVPLNGIVTTNPPTLPQAKPGGTEDYPGLFAGGAFNLKGAATGNVSNSNGYIWYLISKPANSSLVLNGIPGPANLEITPDTAGVYNLSLTVKTNDPIPMYSPSSSVIIAVEPPPTPEPEPEDNP
ncbi:MAG TPA: hypothetical protein EYN66_11270 [Myxococcales bacterium]|nr:hypothetical protein [Myxococcales bacterium]